MNKGRDEFWQSVRGIAIIAVVWIHCRNGLAYKGGSNNLNYEYWYIFRQLFNFPVALFVFLSGYFINPETVVSKNKTWIVERLKGLLVPFFIWSIFYTAIKLIRGKEDLLKEIIKLVIGMASTPLYYILVLIQLTIITPYIIKVIKNSKTLNLKLLLLTPLYLLLCYYYSLKIGNQIFYYQVYFPAWFIFYYMGIWVKLNGEAIFLKKKSLVYSVLLTILSLILSLIEAFFLESNGSLMGYSQIKLTSFIYTFTIINLLFVLKNKFRDIKLKKLKSLGDNSFGIYFVHMFFVALSNKVLVRFEIIKNILPLYQLIQILFILSLSYFTIKVSQSLFPQKALRKSIGF